MKANILGILCICMLFFTLVGFGVLLESSLNDFAREDNRLLTETVQVQHWEIEGYKQLIKQYERGDFNHVIIPLCNDDKTEKLNKGQI